MANSIYHNSRNDRQYRAATGLSRQEFDELYAAFAPFYTPKQANPYAGVSAPVLTDKREALFFVLHYFKAYPTLQNMGLYFGISDAAASHYLDRLKPVLRAALQQEQVSAARLFPTAAALQEAFAGVKDLVLDVTEVPIERAQDNDIQKEHYSGKKTAHVKMAPHHDPRQATAVCEPALGRPRPRLQDVQRSLCQL